MAFGDFLKNLFKPKKVTREDKKAKRKTSKITREQKKSSNKKDSSLKQRRKLTREEKKILYEANLQLRELHRNKLFSSAYYKARREGGYFKPKTNEDILKEVTRAKTFLAHPSSTLEGAEKEIEEMNQRKMLDKYKKAFGYFNGLGYDSSVISDEDKRYLMYSVYHELTEYFGNYILQMYGSDRLLSYIYSSIIDNDEDFTGAYGQAFSLLDQWLEERNKEYNDVFGV